MSMTATADAHAIGPVEELTAWASGRPSYLARRSGPDVHLTRRGLFDLRAEPAGTTTDPVVLEHRCEEHPPPPPPPSLFELPEGHDVGTPRRQRLKNERATS